MFGAITIDKLLMSIFVSCAFSGAANTCREKEKEKEKEKERESERERDRERQRERERERESKNLSKI